jgi:hypothetical protein
MDMKFRVIFIPPFKAVSSGVDKDFDFSENGVLGRFNEFFSKLKPKSEDSFTPRDFLYYDVEKGGLVWIYALTDYIDPEGYETFGFEGGYYVSYHYKDGDNEENERLYKEALLWIEESESFELDQRKDHYAMGHIITPPEVINAIGYAQMESYIPVKLKQKTDK